MAQNRFWNWKDDDSTFRLNQWNLFAIPAGLYRGFYKNSGNDDFILPLSHSGNQMFVSVKEDLTETPALGIWRTRQGSIIVEDADISLTIDNPDSEDRIDLIVGEHQYAETVGGTSATYKVIKGTPSANPIKPVVQNPQTQVALGKLYVPKTASNINDCNWTRYSVSFNNNKIPNLDKNNIFSGINFMAKLDESFTTASIVSEEIKLMNKPANFVYIQDSGFKEVKTMDLSLSSYDNLATPQDSASTVILLTTADILLKNSGNIQLPNNATSLKIPAGTTFYLTRIVSFGGANWFYSGSTGTLLNRSNKFNKTQIWNKSEVKATINGDEEVILPNEISEDGGNYIQLNNPNNETIEAIQSLAYYNRYSTIFKSPNNVSDEAGGIIFLELLHNTSVTNLGAGTSPNTKPVKILYGEDKTYLAGTILMLLEDKTNWLLLSAFNAQFKSDIENLSLNFQKTITEKTTVIENAGDISYQDFGNGDYGWDINKNIGNQVLFYQTGNIGGSFRFMPDSFPIGTKIDIRFSHQTIQFKFDANNNVGSAPNGWLPISKIRDSHYNTAFTFMPQKETTYTLLRTKDRWVLYEEESRLPEWVTGEEDLPHLYLAGKVDIYGGRVGYYGKNRVYDNGANAYYPFKSEKLSVGHYKVTHNLGTDKYVVVAASSDTGNKKASIYDADATSFKVGTSDDATNNDSAFMFMVIRIK